MKTKIKKGVTFATMMLALGTSYSQLKISGEIRPRFEYRHGYKALADSAMHNAAFVDQRTRLNFDYTQNRMQFKVVLQDVRTWGSQKQLVGNEDYGVSIHEAWGQAGLTDNLKMKFGRQELVYDDHRILGNVGWAQQARSHDAVVFKYGKDKLKIHLGAAYNQNKGQLKTTNYSVAKSYKTMQYLWANYKFNNVVKFSFLSMGVGNQANQINTNGDSTYHTNYTLTTGGRLVYLKNKLGVNLSGYYQLGTTPTFPARGVSAYEFAAEATYKFTDKFKTSLGFEMLSGNSQKDTTLAYNSYNHAFNPYFGTNHKFNGFMDYFYVGNFNGSVGLNDAYFKLVYKHSKFTTGFTAHAFLANATVVDPVEKANTGNLKAVDPYLGTELDLFAAFKLAPGTTCKLGYSQMFGTKTMEAVIGGDMREVSNWAYVMIIMKPTFFDSSKIVTKK
jgi:hypothetical protein